MDKLDQIFGMQIELMLKYGLKPVDFHTKDGQNTVRACTIHLIEELCEVLQCLKNKPWVDYETVVDVKEMTDELADCTHFFVELCILLGIDATTLFELYETKNKKNVRRLDTRY